MFYGYLRGLGGQGQGQGRVVEVIESRLRHLLTPAVSKIAFDEKFYVSRNDDVSENLRKGTIKSAHEHYINDGYYEDRLPRPVTVDEAWYLKEYADVAQAVAAGAFLSASHHFFSNGFKEGRLPVKGWSLI